MCPYPLFSKGRAGGSSTARERMSMQKCNWAAVVPMANEEAEFSVLIHHMSSVLDHLGTGTVYMVVDNASKDRTSDLCQQTEAKDPRYRYIWAPENRNVVDAYLRGFREACANGHDFIIEMDAGMSHDPAAIPLFLAKLLEGNDCAFGSRFIEGGSLDDAPLKRRLLSRGGTIVANVMLGTRLHDMTSGYEAFRSSVVVELLKYPLRSTAHFYQTEVRYLLRNRSSSEIPIHYKSPSPRVSNKALKNALKTLFYYFGMRLLGKAVSL